MENKPGYTQSGLPFQGSTPISRHTSAQGAEAAAETRAYKTQLYLDLLTKTGDAGLTDHEAAKAMGVPNTTINSVRANLWPLIVPTGRKVPGPYKNRAGQPIYNATWRLASPYEQQQLREEKARLEDIPF